ncbi:hypothetical protein ABFX02_09G028600 [Erythranthe guttata]
MATFFSLYNCFSLIFILQLLFLSLKTNGAAVDDICNQTTDPPLCIQGFAADADGRSATANMTLLAAVAVDVGLTAAATTKGEVDDRMANEKDRNLVNLYLKCSTFYFHMFDCFGAMMNDLHQGQAGNYADYRKQAAAIRADVDGSEALFNNSSPFASGDKLVGIFADAMVLIADALMS